MKLTKILLWMSVLIAGLASVSASHFSYFEDFRHDPFSPFNLTSPYNSEAYIRDFYRYYDSPYWTWPQYTGSPDIYDAYRYFPGRLVSEDLGYSVYAAYGLYPTDGYGYGAYNSYGYDGYGFGSYPYSGYGAYGYMGPYSAPGYISIPGVGFAGYGRNDALPFGDRPSALSYSGVDACLGRKNLRSNCQPTQAQSPYPLYGSGAKVAGKTSY